MPSLSFRCRVRESGGGYSDESSSPETSCSRTTLRGLGRASAGPACIGTRADLERTSRRHLQRPRPRRCSGVRSRGVPGGGGGVREGIRHGEPGAWGSPVTPVRAGRRVCRQAVHRPGRYPAGAAGQTFTRRSRRSVPAGATRIRGRSDSPAADPPHQRDPRLHGAPAPGSGTGRRKRRGARSQHTRLAGGAEL